MPSPPHYEPPMGPEDTWNLDEPSSSSQIDRGPSDSWRNGRKGDLTVDSPFESSDPWKSNTWIYPYDSDDLLPPRTMHARSPTIVDEDAPYLMPIDYHGTATSSVSDGGTSTAHLRRACKEY